MSSEFFSLADLAAPIKNAIVGGPFGSNLVSKDYVGRGIPVIRGQNMGEKWISGEFVYVSDEKAQALSQNIARPNDLVFTQRGTLGQVSIVPQGRFDKYIVSQSQMKITLDKDKADVTFLYYLFKTPEQLQYIFNSAIQTGVPHTNLGILKATPVRLPPLSLQKQISAVMNVLDDRITLLRETNATLEAIAQALFKSWFVDFDPVHAKQQGRLPEGMDEATAALFPDSFDESELGLVPRGYRVELLSDVFDFKEGPGIRNWQYTNSDEGTRFINIRCIQDGDLKLTSANRITNEEACGKYAHFHLQAWDVVVSTSGTLGRSAIVRQEHLPLMLNTSVIRFQPVFGKMEFSFLYQYLNSSEFLFKLESMASGSVQKNFGPMHLKQMKLLCPSADLLSHYELVTRPLFEKLIENRSSLNTLVTLRDTLLPRLISGKLRLPEAEAMIEEIA